MKNFPRREKHMGFSLLLLLQLYVLDGHNKGEHMITVYLLVSFHKITDTLVIPFVVKDVDFWKLSSKLKNETHAIPWM